MRYEHTEVFTLKSLSDVIAFCKRMLAMKREAPWSLAFTVALTATREVQFRGSAGKPRHVGEDLRDLCLELEGGNASPLPIGKPTSTAERKLRKRRRARRRKPDPTGY